MSPVTDSRLRHAVRGFTLGSGPLKRGSDRVQMLARFLVVLAFLAAPPIAVVTATVTTTHYEAVAAAQAADRERSRALVLEDADPSGPGDDTAGARVVQVRARWSSPAGVPREGTLLVPPDTRDGATVPVWVDQEGNLTRAPMDPRSIPSTAAAMAVLPLLGVPLVAWALYAALCAALDAYRDRRWTEGWAAVEPGWGAQLP